MSRQGGKECFHGSLVEQGNGRGIGQAKAKESFAEESLMENRQRRQELCS
jgi:hypothetical protein